MPTFYLRVLQPELGQLTGTAVFVSNVIRCANLPFLPGKMTDTPLLLYLVLPTVVVKSRMRRTIAMLAAGFARDVQGSGRNLLDSSAPAPSLMPATLPGLTATQAVDMLCSREITAVEYVEALFDRYYGGGFECLNSWITINETMVTSSSSLPPRAASYRIVAHVGQR